MSDRDGPRSHGFQVATLGALVAAGLATYLLLNHLFVQALVTEFPSRGVLKTSVYLLWLACAFVVFFSLLLTLRRIGLFLLSLVLCFSVAANYLYARLVSRAITPASVEWMVHEFQGVPQMWGEYSTLIIVELAKAAVALSIFLALRVLILRHELIRGGWITRPRVRGVALAAFLAFHGMIMLIQPSYAVAETNIIVFGLPAGLKTVPERRGVPVHLRAAPRVDKIVVVIDESVNHEVYADLIAPRLRAPRVFDFGKAASVSACSAPSNALLRWGIERSRIGERGYDPRRNPTIWQFAKQAGFRTTLIDGQSGGVAHNLLSMGEMAFIDDFVPAATGLQSDHRIALMLTERLDRAGRELIYIVKRGSHFPYEKNYPAGMVPDDAPKTLKYAAAVTFSTGGFFDLLGDTLARPDMLMIYTSDHGQNVGAPAAHCSGQEHPDEYAVPLIVLGDAPSVKSLLAPALPGMRDRASHLNIFPTLLYGLGYPPDWIDATYGATLAGPPAPYVRVGKLPYPTNRNDSVKFETTTGFPGRGQK